MIPLGQKITLIEERDFDKYVTRLYGRPYCFQQQNDCMYGQNSIHLFSVPDPEGEFESDEEFRECHSGPTLTEWATAPVDVDQRIDAWRTELHWHREFYPVFEVLVNDLYKRGLLPEGQYGLHIWW